MIKGKNEAADIALDKFFKSNEVSGDNFLLDADRDHFIFKGGFSAGCEWILKRFSDKFISDIKNIHFDREEKIVGEMCG